MAVDKQIVDQQIAALGQFSQWFTKKELRYLPEVMVPGEIVMGLTSGLYQNNTWLIAVTNRRVLFLDKGLIYGLKQLELPLAQISAIAHKTGLLFGTISISTSSATEAITQIVKADTVNIANIISSLVADWHKPKSSSHSVTQPTDLISQLERLAALKDKGLLTEAEFQTQKDKLLSA